MTAGLSLVREEMTAGLAAVRAEMVEGFTSPAGALSRAVEGLRAEIRDGDAETRREMRVLHEDLVTRIALIREGNSSANRKRRKRH
jgi:hypothetical protein